MYLRGYGVGAGVGSDAREAWLIVRVILNKAVRLAMMSAVVISIGTASGASSEYALAE